MKKLLGCLVCLVVLTASVWASEIILKTDQKFQGNITDKGKDYITVDVGVGTPMTFYYDEIKTIDGESVPQAQPVNIEAGIVVNKPQEAVAEAAPEAVPEAPPAPTVVLSNKDLDNAPVVTEEKVEKVVSTQVTETKTINPVQEEPAKAVAPPPPVSSNVQPVNVGSTNNTVTVKKNYSVSSSTYKRANGDQVSKMALGMGLGIIGFIFLFFIGIYVFCSFLMYRIAVKLNTPNPWLVWIPIVSIYPTIQMSGRPMWILAIFVLSIVPFIGIIFSLLSIGFTVYIWMGIAEKCSKPGWYGFLMLIPLVNIFIMWDLAFSKS